MPAICSRSARLMWAYAAMPICVATSMASSSYLQLILTARQSTPRLKHTTKNHTNTGLKAPQGAYYYKDVGLTAIEDAGLTAERVCNDSSRQDIVFDALFHSASMGGIPHAADRPGHGDLSSAGRARRQLR